MKAVIDTNVLLVANGQHADVSPSCVTACVTRLQEMGKAGITVIDDDFRILGEYLNKSSINPAKGVGDVFLKNLLRHTGNPKKCEQVVLTETGVNEFSEFPDHALQPAFDAPDRKFAAVAYAHIDKPPVWQAADCKWIDWWPALHAKGISIEFLCSDDVCRFYRKKFPEKPLPALPG
jgi:hypothetical protein